jgi:hypothetical protein
MRMICATLHCAGKYPLSKTALNNWVRYKTENTDVGIRHADNVAPSLRKSWQSLRRQAVVARSVSSLADSDHGVFLWSFIYEICIK